MLLLPTAATPPSFFVVLSFFRRSKCAPAPTRTPPTPPGPPGPPSKPPFTTATATAISAILHRIPRQDAALGKKGRRKRERASAGRPDSESTQPKQRATTRRRRRRRLHGAGRGRCAASVSRFLLRASWWPRWRLSTTSSPPPPTIVAPLHGGGGLQVVPRHDDVPRGIRERSRASEGRRRDAAAIFNCSASCMRLPVSRVSERETE